MRTRQITLLSSLLALLLVSGCAGGNLFGSDANVRTYSNNFTHMSHAVLDAVRAMNMDVMEVDESSDGQISIVAEHQSAALRHGGTTSEARAQQVRVQVVEVEGGTRVHLHESVQSGYGGPDHASIRNRFFQALERQRGVTRAER